MQCNRSSPVCVNVNNLPENQVVLMTYLAHAQFCGLCRLQNFPTTCIFPYSLKMSYIFSFEHQNLHLITFWILPTTYFKKYACFRKCRILIISQMGLEGHCFLGSRILRPHLVGHLIWVSTAWGEPLMSCFMFPWLSSIHLS